MKDGTEMDGICNRIHWSTVDLKRMWNTAN